MKEQEAIRILGDTTLCTPLGQAAFVAIEDIKKLQQYQALGTVEELREAREKQRAKKLLNKIDMKDFNGKTYSFRGNCARCGLEVVISTSTNYCPNCGQAIDWSEEE